MTTTEEQENTTEIDRLRAELAVPTPAGVIKHLPSEAGGYPYVATSYVIRELNRIFAFDWDFETDLPEFLSLGEIPSEVRVRGRLTVRIAGQAISKSQWGAGRIEYKRAKEVDGSHKPVSLAQPFKSAASDALKKCASLLGVGLDVLEQAESFAARKCGERPEKKTMPEGFGYNGFWTQARAAGMAMQDGKRILAEYTAEGQKAPDWQKLEAAMPGLIKNALNGKR